MSTCRKSGCNHSDHQPADEATIMDKLVQEMVREIDEEIIRELLELSEQYNPFEPTT